MIIWDTMTLMWHNFNDHRAFDGLVQDCGNSNLLAHWSYHSLAQIYWYNYNDRVQVKSFQYDHLGADSIKRCHLTSIWSLIVEIRRSYDRLISTMGFPILVRRHLYIESGPRVSPWRSDITSWLLTWALRWCNRHTSNTDTIYLSTPTHFFLNMA